MNNLSPEQLRAEALLRVLKALELIETAQNNLSGACAQLSALQGACAQWRATSKLYDRVKAHWYRLERFRHQSRFKLDRTNIEALQRRQTEDSK
jgi:hypothetical protein